MVFIYTIGYISSSMRFSLLFFHNRVLSFSSSYTYVLWSMRSLLVLCTRTLEYGSPTLFLMQCAFRKRFLLVLYIRTLEYAISPCLTHSYSGVYFYTPRAFSKRAFTPFMYCYKLFKTIPFCLKLWHDYHWMFFNII